MYCSCSLLLLFLECVIIISSLHSQENARYDTFNNLFICKDHKI